MADTVYKSASGSVDRVQRALLDAAVGGERITPDDVDRIIELVDEMAMAIPKSRLKKYRVHVCDTVELLEAVKRSVAAGG